MQLIESLSEMDEEIIDKFLGCDADHFKVSSQDIKDSLRKMTLLGKCVPTLCGAAFRNIGIQPLMDSMVDYLPSPENSRLPEVNIESDKLCALAFKVLDDDKRGPLVFVRVYSGNNNILRNRIHKTSICIKK
jgi:elongation factor G